MGARYPDQVGGHNPCEPEFGYVHMSPFGTVYCLATTVAIGAFGRHGATHELAQWGVSRSGRESVMAMGGFCRNVVGPPKWECEAMDSVVWVQCANLCRVCVKTNDSHARG